MLIERTVTGTKSYGLLAPDKELRHTQCLLFIIYFLNWPSGSTHSLVVEICVCRGTIIHLPQVSFFSFFLSPEYLLTFSNCQKCIWELKALDRYHDAIFNNDNLGKKSQNIFSNHLLVLDRNRDFTERDYMWYDQTPHPNSS